MPAIRTNKDPPMGGASRRAQTDYAAGLGMDARVEGSRSGHDKGKEV